VTGTGRLNLSGFPVTMLIAGLVLLLWTPRSARADDPTPARSETGRHAPPAPAETAKMGSARDSGLTVKQGKWVVGIGAGFLGGGTLWRLETANGAVVPWVAATPFASARFNAKLDNNAAASLSVGRRLNRRWSWRADLRSSTMNLAAEALQGQSGGLFLYDSLQLRSWGISLEARLVDQASYPYVSVGPVLNQLTATREKDLAQNQVGYQLGLGFVQDVNERLQVRIEAIYLNSSFSTGGFQPSVREGRGLPPLIFVGADRLRIFGVVLAAQWKL